ncbi:MAG: AAA family ATPase [Eubacterium sp.]|jgi:cellulose biosynthesis protein BcsQ|nr:AAA family ATPase [Eubacterium sp.]
MGKPRVIIADEDMNYVVPLQLKFAKDFFEKVELEVITDRSYFDELFSKPQKAEILIISDQWYDQMLQKHNIANIFEMMEQYEEGGTGELNVNKMFKYTSLKEIFNEIVGKSAGAFNIVSERQETQIVLVTSANGGAGKTTVAMGISACLVKNYKRVLYINASRLQCFQHLLDNHTSVSSSDIYGKLVNSTEQIYQEIKHVIRKEIFSYLPSFKAALMSVGIPYSVFGQIASSAKESEDYDFIVIDAESTFDEEKTRLLDIADKVIVVTEQHADAVEAANLFAANVNGSSSDKYFFVCNRFDKEKTNALIRPDIVLKFSVNDYIEQISEHELASIERLEKSNGIRKISFLVL